MRSRRSRGACREGSVWEFELDLARGESETARLFEFALDVLGGRLDVLLHVAGISGRKFGDAALHECSTEAWDSVMRINAFGVFLTNRNAVQCMLPAAARFSRTAGDRGECRVCPGPFAFPEALRNDCLCGEQGGRSSPDAGGGGAVCAGPHSVQFDRARFDRYTDGRPSGERRSRSALPGGEAAASRVDRERRWTWPKPLSICVSRPRDSLPGPSWSSTAAGAFRRETLIGR